MSEDQRYSKEGRAGWDPTKGSVRNQTSLSIVGLVEIVSNRLQVRQNSFKVWPLLVVKVPAAENFKKIQKVSKNS